MKLEEAKERVNKIKENWHDLLHEKYCYFEDDVEAIETVLQELEHLQKENEELKEIDLTTVYIKGVYDEKDRWREKIDNRISIVENLLDEMVDKNIGCINTSYLSKKEKEEVMNKRNCLLVQKATLEDIKNLLKEEWVYERL